MIVLIFVEIILCVVFASAMVFYMGLHLKNSINTIEDDTNFESEGKEKTTDVNTQMVEGKNSVITFGKKNALEVINVIKKKNLFWLFFTMVVLALCTWFYDMFYLEVPILKSYMNSVVFALVITMGYIDYKEHIIPNPLVLTGMGIWVIGSILEIFIGGTPWKDVLIFSLTGFGVCGGLLLILAIVLRSGFGMGDVKMYAMLGLLYGLSNTYSLLICTVIPMAVFALILLAGKKVTKKSTLPMAPFTVFAFLIGILSGM